MAEKLFYTKPEVDKLISDVREELLKEIEAYKTKQINVVEDEEEGE